MASAELFISEQGLTCQYSATLRRRSPVPVCLLGCGSRPAEAAGHATARRTAPRSGWTKGRALLLTLSF